MAGDLLWYPVEGKPKIRTAPDTMVVFGRPKGDRGSYMQWLEENIPPQVVFEILSPGNRAGRMVEKSLFYQQYGVDEYYVYDPDDGELSGFLRDNGGFKPVPAMDGWVSPKLGCRFELHDEKLRMFRPDGTPFLSEVEMDDIWQAERERADSERERANAEYARANRLAEKLRQLGVADADL